LRKSHVVESDSRMRCARMSNKAMKGDLAPIEARMTRLCEIDPSTLREHLDECSISHKRYDVQI